MDEQQRRQVRDSVIAARKARGWSQVRLAQVAGVSENTVISIETGRRASQVGKLRKVLDALDLAPPMSSTTIDLEGVPEDVRIFLKVAAQRLSVLDETQRAVLLADLYPRLLTQP